METFNKFLNESLMQKKEFSELELELLKELINLIKAATDFFVFKTPPWNMPKKPEI
jgi:hypothetical protein